MNKDNKTNNNFKKAVNELLGNLTDDNPEPEVQESAEPQFFGMSDHRGQPEGEPKPSFTSGAYTQAPPPETATQQTIGAAASVSLIAPDMAIMGNLSSNTNMTICGRVIGNVICGGSVVISGDVEGDISASELEIFGSISGNITVSGKVTICNDAHVNGNIIAHELYTSGLIEGDIKAEGMAFFQSTAVIVGNVYAKTFEMSGGAKIKGLVKTYN